MKHLLDVNVLISPQVSDQYLAGLAAKHGFKLATFDERLNHPSAELVS